MLTTHIVIAAAVAKPFAHYHPAAGFFAALASHYLADAVPHWDYAMHAIETKDDAEKLHWDGEKARVFRRRARRDILHFAVDGLAGVSIILLLIRPIASDQWLWAAAAIIGGTLPDFLQGAYLSGATFLKPLQCFHDFCHTKIKLGPYPLIGIPLQLIILLAVGYFLL